MRELKTEPECRIVYADIIRGSSPDISESFFIKHYSESDFAHTEALRVKFLKEGIKEQLMLEKDKLILLKEHEHWSESEEKEYQTLKEEITDLQFSLRRLIIPQQITHMRGLIDEKNKIFSNLFISRTQLLGTTAEQYASKRASESHILRAFFKDGLCKIPYFTDEDTDDLSIPQVNFYINVYQEINNVFYDNNFKKIAVCPFFMNAFHMANDDVMNFYGLPICNLSLYQMALFNKGRFYKNIQSDPEAKSPPEEYYEDLDAVIKFFDSQYSIIMGKRTENQLLK